MYKYKSLQVGQLPREHLSLLQNLPNFIITKYFKQEVDDDLSAGLDERSSCGLSITGDIKISMLSDQKVMTLLAPMKKCPVNFYHGVVFTAQI